MNTVREITVKENSADNEGEYGEEDDGRHGEREQMGKGS